MTASVLAPAYGEVFTRRWVVDLILDLAGYVETEALYAKVAVEPAVGSGAFLGPIIERLLRTRPEDASWLDLSGAIRAFDLQPQHVETCRRLVMRLLDEAGCPQVDAEHLAKTWVRQADFLLDIRSDLFEEREDIAADWVIGNPPYIRIEDLDPGLLARYRAAAPTMGGRADVFVGFYEHGLDLLKPGGRVAFICADRWMRNSYGRALRRKIVMDGFAVDDVVVMHEAPAFETEVSAYPAITVLRRGDQGRVLMATATEKFDGSDAAAVLLSWSARAGNGETLGEQGVEAAFTSAWHRTDDVWPGGSPARIAWLADLARRFPLLEDSSGDTRLGIGIATGADKIYIPERAPQIEPGQLVPMAMAGDVRSGRFLWSGRHLVSPWNHRGVIEPREAPLTLAYYQDHFEALSKRNVASRSPHWYRTIDRLNHELLKHDLIVMQDMKAHTDPVRVPAGYYPHHNLTWIRSSAWDLAVLGGLLLSEVVERQVAAWCVHMRGGTLRFQPTVLRKVRIPDPHSIAPTVARDLADAFRARDRGQATRAAMSAYGLEHLPA